MIGELEKGQDAQHFACCEIFIGICLFQEGRNQRDKKGHDTKHFSHGSLADQKESPTGLLRIIDRSLFKRGQILMPIYVFKILENPSYTSDSHKARAANTD